MTRREAHGREARLRPERRVPGKVRNLCGTAAAATANGGSGYNFTTARLDPVNRTGGGADPYSRNFNFHIPLVSLPGRAGLDLGLTLSFNSLVWTNLGFRLGFPSSSRGRQLAAPAGGQPVRY